MTHALKTGHQPGKVPEWWPNTVTKQSKQKSFNSETSEALFYNLAGVRVKTVKIWLKVQICTDVIIPHGFCLCLENVKLLHTDLTVLLFVIIIIIIELRFLIFMLHFLTGKEVEKCLGYLMFCYWNRQHMTPLIQPALYLHFRLVVWCNDVGNIFLAHFEPIDSNTSWELLLTMCIHVWPHSSVI